MGRKRGKKSIHKPPLVISLGGSAITKDNYKYVGEICENLKDISQNYHLFVVTGGGTLARDFINILKDNEYIIDNMKYIKTYYSSSLDVKKLKQHLQDEIGIEVTRLHAKLIASIIGYKKYPVPITVKRAIEMASHYSVCVMGGTFPGRSTDAVAAELAVKSGAKMILNVGDIKGIYDKDPHKYEDAKILHRLSYNELWNIIKNYDQRPGKYTLFDHEAFKIIKKHKIKVKFLHFSDLKDFEREDIGTIVE